MLTAFPQFSRLIFMSVALLVAVCPAVYSQHQGHNMPGMTKPKPKAKTKVPAQTKKQVDQKAPTTPETNTASAPPTAEPTPTPSSTPQAPTHDEMPAMTHEHQAPQAAAMPSPETHSTHMHPPAAPGGESKPSETPASDSRKGMDMTSGVSMNMGPLLVMTPTEMGVRVGSSDSNIIPMSRMASGTSWNPASTPLHMLHKQSGDWLLMFHYNAIVGVNLQGGPRGVTKFESQNWFMPMAFHKLGRGTVELRGMFSFEPFTFPRGGSPLLFQTGETYKGQPIIDAQHPHDLFMELSTSYTAPLGERSTWFVYFGYPGEPALGPTAFMHRASASENPAAVLSHHYQDSSHISFGVFTGGITCRWLKFEGSIFNGREPDENRYNFEAHPWNSRSARLSVAPNANWTMQISHGFLRNPEALEPGDVRRTTASVSYNRRFARANWATSLIWGRNHESHGGEIFNLNGYVAESTINFIEKNYVYTRLELVDKNQLLRAVDRARLGITDHHPSFRIGAYTFGAVRDVWNTDKVSLGIGADATFYSKPSVLNVIYGDNPASFRFFLRFRPAKMKMNGPQHIHPQTMPE